MRVCICMSGSEGRVGVRVSEDVRVERKCVKRIQRAHSISSETNL